MVSRVRSADRRHTDLGNFVPGTPSLVLHGVAEVALGEDVPRKQDPPAKPFLLLFRCRCPLAMYGSSKAVVCVCASRRLLLV